MAEKVDSKKSDSKKMDSDKGDSKCGTCSKKVTNHDDGVQCEVCNVWFHCKCQRITDEMYRSMQSYKDDLHWYCAGCKGAAGKLLSILAGLQTKMDKMEEELIRCRAEWRMDLAAEITKVGLRINNGERLNDNIMKTSVEQMEKVESKIKEWEKRMEESIQRLGRQMDERGNAMTVRLDNCEKKLMEVNCVAPTEEQQKTWASIVAKDMDGRLTEMSGAVSGLQQKAKEMQQDLVEQENINSRKSSIIIHGLKEPEGANSDDWKKNDRDMIAELLHVAGCDTVSVNACIRLGPRREGGKSRPVKLIMASEAQKDLLLRSSKNLRGTAMDDVFLHQDLTPRQREARQLLVKELRERKASGEKDIMIVGSRIVKRSPREERVEG